MRKIYILLVVLVLVTMGMAFLYFSNLNKENNSSDNSLNIVANNAAIVFTFENDKSFFDILSGQHIIQDILGTEKSNFLGSIKHELSNNHALNALIDGEKVFVGFVPDGRNNVAVLLATQLKPATVKKDITQLLNLANAKPEGNLYRINLSDSAICYATVQSSSIIICNSKQALQQLPLQHTVQHPFTDYIKQHNRFNKNTLANIYIDYNRLPALLQQILNSPLTGELHIFNKQNAYASLSYNFGSDTFLLNGYTDIQDMESYFKLFVNQPEQKISIDQLFPEQTANYALYHIANYEEWSKAWLKYLQNNRKWDKIAAQHQAINEKYRIDIQQIFPKYFNHQLASLQLKSGEKLGIIALKNGDKLNQLLLDLSTEYAPDIRIFKEPDLLYHFFGEPFKKFERPFYTIIDNNLIIANYASSIQVFLNSYKNNKLLINEADYNRFKDQTSSAATIAFYINNKNSNDIFGRNLKMPYYQQYRAINGFKDYIALGYQLSADNGKFLSNMILLKQPQKADTTSQTTD